MNEIETPLGCHNDDIRRKLESQIAGAGPNLAVKTIPSWYFQ